MTSENEKLDVEKLLKNKLKTISVADLENKIAEVVSEFVGEDYSCIVEDIKYSMFSSAEFRIKLELSLNSDTEK